MSRTEWLELVGLTCAGPILSGLGLLALPESTHSYGYGLIAFGLTSGLLCAGWLIFESWRSRRIDGDSFVIKPIAGSASGYFHLVAGDPTPFEPRILFAQLEIESLRFLRDCTVTVAWVEEIGSQMRRLYRHAGGPFELSWSEAGEMKRDLTPGVPRRINVARFDQRERFFQIAPGGSDRPKYLGGWYKVTILVASESDDSVVQTYEGKMALGKRQNPPPPLAFWDWHDGDENRVEFEEV